MVAATLRHLTSLRLMVRYVTLFFDWMILTCVIKRRDSGWIHTLLEEAENERMHLM
jgi:hypothetical protein